MAILSKCQTVPVSCKDYVHPWSESCVWASSTLLLPCLKESFRIYVTAYSVAMLLRGKVPNGKELAYTFLGIVRSCIFLTSHGVGYSGMACFLRRVLGRYNFYTASFLPSFLSSILSILIERPSRRVLLSLYVTNVASETLFRMAVSRKLIKPVQYGEVFVFSASSAFLLYIYRNHGLPKDPVYSLLKFLVGPYEEFGYTPSESLAEPPNHLRPETKKKIGTAQLKWIQFLNWFQTQVYLVKCGISHPSCPHPYSCSYYVLEGACRKFFYGYLTQLCIKLLMNSTKIVKSPSLALRIPFWPETFRLAAMFSAFCGIFRYISCWGRETCDKDLTTTAIPAGFVAGLSFCLYRDNSIALYFMWKLLQITYGLGVEKGYCIELPYAPVFFHAFSTAILFHTAIMEPKNLRLSYWNFLQAMSGGKIGEMSRDAFDAYGLESSKQLSDLLARVKAKK
ncbi:Transmembrane protein 135 [Nesidiocoris tenuis]|uniref:Transmembrane protein 135 n=1 Tax=Nesidiocoris tenuis TaxID=355587 RepID=A0ABN7ALL5_9HEMI|nr:Transmembrane protein 135 [Nesidiocoris tenuis]